MEITQATSVLLQCLPFYTMIMQTMDDASIAIIWRCIFSYDDTLHMNSVVCEILILRVSVV